MKVEVIGKQHLKISKALYRRLLLRIAELERDKKKLEIEKENSK